MANIAIQNYNARAALKKDEKFLDQVSIILMRTWQTMITSEDPENVILAKKIRDDFNNKEVYRWGMNIAGDDTYVQKVTYSKITDESGNSTFEFSWLNDEGELEEVINRLWNLMKLL